MTAKRGTRSAQQDAAKKPLSDQHRRFVEEFLIDLNARQAAIRSGYGAKNAASVACRVMARPEVQEAIAAGQAARSARTEITADQVLKELAKVGFANIKDHLRATATGDPAMELALDDADKMAAVSEVTVEDYMDGRGEDAREVRRVKFKMHDKISALVNIGKHLGMFKQEHEHSTKNGQPLFGPAVVEVVITQPDAGKAKPKAA